MQSELRCIGCCAYVSFNLRALHLSNADRQETNFKEDFSVRDRRKQDISRLNNNVLKHVAEAMGSKHYDKP